jgi:hypothetical protein
VRPAARLRVFALSALLGAALCYAAYAPFWFGIETLRAERRAAMYSGSLPTVVRQLIAPALDGKNAETWLIATPNTNALLANSTLLLFAICYSAALWQVVRGSAPSAQALRSITYILFAYLLDRSAVVHGVVRAVASASGCAAAALAVCGKRRCGSLTL